MRKTACRLAWVVCGGWFAGAIAWGAAETPESREPVSFGVGLRGEYTDNRDSVETDEESTFDFYVTPRLDAYLHGNQTLFNFYFAPSYRYRTDPSDIQNENELLYALGLDVDHDLSDRTQLRLRERFDYQDDPSIESGTAVRGDRTYMMNTAEVGVGQKLTRLTALDASAGYYLKNYKDDDVAQESDEDRLDGALVVRQQIDNTLLLQGESSYTMYGFDSATGLDRDFDVLLAAVGAEKVFSPNLRGGINAGAQFVEYSDATLDGEVFPYGLASVTVSPTPAARINGALGHGVRDSDVYPFASQEYTEFRGGVEVDPSATLTVGVSGTVRDSQYDESSLPAGGAGLAQDTSGSETTVVLGAHVSLKVNDNARVTARQQYEDVDSDVESSFTRNTSSVLLQIDI